MTVTIPLWLIAAVVFWLVAGVAMHAVTFYTSPYRSGKEAGFGRGEDALQLGAALIFWPLIAVSLPSYFHNLRKNKKAARGEQS